MSHNIFPDWHVFFCVCEITLCISGQLWHLLVAYIFFRSDCFIQVYKVVTSQAPPCVLWPRHTFVWKAFFSASRLQCGISATGYFLALCVRHLSHSCKSCCSWLCRLDGKYWLSSLCLHPYSRWHRVGRATQWKPQLIRHLNCISCLLVIPL